MIPDWCIESMTLLGRIGVAKTTVTLPDGRAYLVTARADSESAARRSLLAKIHAAKWSENEPLRTPSMEPPGATSDPACGLPATDP
jgi:hypothetical protein